MLHRQAFLLYCIYLNSASVFGTFVHISFIFRLKKSFKFQQSLFETNWKEDVFAVRKRGITDYASFVNFIKRLKKEWDKAIP